MLDEQQWHDFARDGFLHLGQVLTSAEVAALCERADQLALGQVRNAGIEMQLDTGGAYEELPGAVRSFAEGTLLYRKIQGLEKDPLFLPLVRHPLFAEVCAHQYGAHAPVSIFRAMVMNKPAGQGTHLPWHQDGGDVWKLDRDPLVTIWIALDKATQANGCMDVVPGTHRLGLLTTYGSTVGADDVARHCPDDRMRPLEVESGHAVLLHNWLIHRSGVNPSPVPRRAVTICYLDGRTVNTLTGNRFPMIFGEDGAHLDMHFVTQMRAEAERLRAEGEAMRSSLRFALRCWLDRRLRRRGAADEAA